MIGQLLSLEVIGGPMDGLRRPVSGREFTIGKKVGRSMTLDRDRKISREHARICPEGPDWCLREREGKPSKNGTWLSGKWIEPGESYPLTPGQVILMASTVMEVIPDAPDHSDSVVYNDWDDPVNIYEMSPEMKEIWSRLMSESQKQGFFDSADLFREVFEYVRAAGDREYESVANILSPACWVALGEWIISKRLEPLYNVDAGDVIITCRIWRILELASRDRTQEIRPQDILQAILLEGRSIPARYMACDGEFIRDMNLYLPEIAIPSPMSKAVDISRTRTDSVDNSSSTAMPLRGAISAEVEFWQNQVGDFEKTILAFIEDALIPPGVKILFNLPGFDKQLDKFLETQDKAAISEYLDALRSALFNVMGAYRDGARQLEKEMANRIRESLARFDQQPGTNKGLWPITKGDDAKRLAQDMLATLKKVEIEGLAERIIRQKIHSLFQNGGRS